MRNILASSALALSLMAGSMAVAQPMPSDPMPSDPMPAAPAVPADAAPAGTMSTATPTVVDNTLPPPPAATMNKTYPVCTRQMQDNCQNPGEGGAPGRSRASDVKRHHRS